MTIDEALSHYHTVAAVARAMDAARPSVYKWAKTGIPLPYQALLQLRSDGCLMADPEARRVVERGEIPANHRKAA